MLNSLSSWWQQISNMYIYIYMYMPEISLECIYIYTRFCMSESLLVARWSSPCEKRAIMTIHVHHRRFEACTSRRKRGRMGVRRKRGREAQLRSSTTFCLAFCLFHLLLGRRLCLFHLLLGLSPLLSPFQPLSMRKIPSCRRFSLVL